MSHIISQIKIINYRSIILESFDLSDYTPLVGYNNAGKSNVLNAIKWLLRKSSLTVEMFNQRNMPIIVEGKIEGIDAALLQTLDAGHRASIQPYLNNNELLVKRVQNIPSETLGNIKLYIRNFAATTQATEWVANPAGIDNAINALFPEPIQIGAMENAEEDVSKSKTSSTIGKLLAEIIGPIEVQYGAHLQTALNGLKDILDAEGQNRAPELTQFDTDMNNKIGSFFPGVNIKLHVPTPELKEVFSKGTIKVYEQQLTGGRDVSSLGHGAQRSIQMALIRHLADLKRINQNHNTTTLLLIDEPELYLHPQAIEVIRDALKTLSAQGYQVVFSTHSAMMVNASDLANAILIRKNDTLGTHIRRTLKASVTQVETDNPSQIQLLYSLSNSSQILFSEKVVLIEGRTEQKILPALIEKLTNRTLGLHKCALIKLDGSGSTRKAMEVLAVMDLPTKAIVDLDYAFKRAINDNFLQQTDVDIIACKQHLASMVVSHGITLGTDGYPMGGTMSASAAFALLSQQPQVQQNIQNLHTKLLAQNIWIWKSGAIEHPLGLQGKTEYVWANFCDQLKIQNLNILAADHVVIEDCINWITS